VIKLLSASISAGLVVPLRPTVDVYLAVAATLGQGILPAVLEGLLALLKTSPDAAIFAEQNTLETVRVALLSDNMDTRARACEYLNSITSGSQRQCVVSHGAWQCMTELLAAGGLNAQGLAQAVTSVTRALGCRASSADVIAHCADVLVCCLASCELPSVVELEILSALSTASSNATVLSRLSDYPNVVILSKGLETTDPAQAISVASILAKIGELERVAAGLSS